MTFIIVFQLSEPARNREQLLQKIKGLGAWARLTGNGYLISTAVTDPVVLRDSLTSTLLANDRLYIGVAAAPSAWTGMPEDVSKWILANQK
jgi:hypothetical protein